VDGKEDARVLLLSMVRFSFFLLYIFSFVIFYFRWPPRQIGSKDITAQIDANGMVTFSNPPLRFRKERVDGMFRDVQE